MHPLNNHCLTQKEKKKSEKSEQNLNAYPIKLGIPLADSVNV